jgi:hypothetical protein
MAHVYFASLERARAAHNDHGGWLLVQMGWKRGPYLVTQSARSSRTTGGAK